MPRVSTGHPFAPQPSTGGRAAGTNTTITAEFTADGRVAGRSGCNSYGGSAKAASGRLTVGELASTLMACQADGVMPQESRYLAALQAATAYAVAGGELRLGPSATAASLVFGSRD
ncbi:MAG: META domain-containing protein [Vicinamibacteria bacterium]